MTLELTKKELESLILTVHEKVNELETEHRSLYTLAKKLTTEWEETKNDHRTKPKT